VPYYVIVSTGEGNNRVEVAEDAANPAKPLAIYGGQANDYLSGGSANDSIYGLGGVDTIYGRGGDDYLVACYGIENEIAPMRGEFIDGGPGNDTLIGSKANDTLIGGAPDATRLTAVWERTSSSMASRLRTSLSRIPTTSWATPSRNTWAARRLKSRVSLAP